MDEGRFIDLAFANGINRLIVERLPKLGLHDAWLVSGSLFQTAWNELTGRAPDYGIKDYDIFYFDPDMSWEAEDAVIRRCAALFADIDAAIEIRNQARVHLWYPEKFGQAYTALATSSEGIDRFLMSVSKVGIGNDAGTLRIYAPEGLSDIEAMTIRPCKGPFFHPGVYAQKAARWKERWPELAVIDA